MKAPLVPPIAGMFVATLGLSACTSVDREAGVPDLIVQHALSSLASGQSFAWDDSNGRVLVISPLGTFKSGDFYCRDYEIASEDASEAPIKKTACRFDNRWKTVDPSKLVV